jgi:periplasmic protein TonB
MREGGRVSDLKVISAPPMLVDAAVGAVQQWRNRPYSANGEPVAVETLMTVHFHKN